MTAHSLAIVGGGPFCTYALERLAALLPGVSIGSALTIHVFERTGRFGAGATHSDEQAPTSFLNRVASQVAFGADETNVAARTLLPRALRPTLVEWSQAKYRITGDSRFNLRPTDVPPRYLHGEALRDVFDGYAARVRQIRGVTLELHVSEVIDIEREGNTSFRVHFRGDTRGSVRANHVLLVTGHSTNRAAPGSIAAALERHASTMPPARYVAQPYPLRDALCEEAIPSGTSVGVLGLGLTAIDVILNLTEGRGGTFRATTDAAGRPTLEYTASGREPGAIVAVSPSGMFTWSRAENKKASDATGMSHSALQHSGAFLTIPAIRALRAAVGKPAAVVDVEVYQLDFERHVFPLVVLELAFVYYATLFGPSVAREIAAAVEPRYRAFLGEGCASRDAGIASLLEPLHAVADDVATYVDLVSAGETVPERLRWCDDTDVLATFRRTIDADGRGVSRWGHSTVAREHRFDWLALFHPVSRANADGAEWRRRLVEAMKRDQLGAEQGNVRNPVKAACDGVWRDLRAVFSEVADFGGLTAGSHRRFVEVYWRHYARMSNGASLAAMRKILALVEAGVVDVSIGPDPAVAPVHGRPLFRIAGSVTRAQRDVAVLVEGRGHAFDAERDVCPLYPSLLRRGLVRLWECADVDAGTAYRPGALELSRDLHPVQSDGSVERRLTILGAPAEGLIFFQLSAARPHSNSMILNQVARWANEWIEALAGDAPSVGLSRCGS